MKPLSHLIFLGLILLALPSHGDDTVTMQGRINWNESEPSKVRIGVFDSPIRTGAEAHSWTSVETAEFDLSVPDRDEVQLVVLCQDFMPQLKTIYPASPTKQFVLELEKGITVEGTVLSTDKLPVARTGLTLEREDLPKVRIPWEYSFRWVSDADGRFKIGGLSPFTSYEIRVKLPYVYEEHETFSVEVEENDIQDLDLRLVDAYFVLGRVLDGDLEGVEGASIRFRSEREYGFLRDSNINSGSNGEFRLGPLKQSTDLVLMAVHEELGSSPEVEATPGMHDVELVLGGTVHVVGTVIDQSTAKFIDDFTITTMGPNVSRTYSYSDASGEISSHVDRATIGLIVDSADHIAYFALDVYLRSADVYDMGVIELHRGRQLTGEVYDVSNGQPIEGALVLLQERDDELIETDAHWWNLKSQYLRRSSQSFTDEMGQYELGPIPAHSTHMSAFADGYSSDGVQVEEGVTQLDIGLAKESEETGRIKGMVLTKMGMPVGGMVRFEGSRTSSSAPLGDNGTFDADLRTGEYEVYALTDKGKSETVRVVLNVNEVLEVNLVVDSKGLLTGVIEGLMDGETVYVWVWSETEQLQIGRLDGLGNGAFEIEGVGFGTFRLNAQTNRNRSTTQSFELSEGKSEVQVDLNFVGQSRLYGSLKYPDGTVLRGTVTAASQQDGQTSSSADVSGDGTFEITGLDDGEYTIFIYETKQATMKTPRGSVSMSINNPLDEVDVEIRGDTELDFQLTRPSDPD